MHLMKDTKEGYKQFTSFFNFYNNVGENELLACSKGHTIKSLKVVSP